MFRVEAETKRQESRSRLLKLIGSSVSVNTPTMIKREPSRVIVLPSGSSVPNKSAARRVPTIAVGVSESSRKKMPDLRERFWMERNSGEVPTTVTEGRKESATSPLRELTEMASGATEATLSSFLIVLTSLRVRLDLRYLLE